MLDWVVMPSAPADVFQKRRDSIKNADVQNDYNRVLGNLPFEVLRIGR